MSFTREVKPPKRSYDAPDHSWADAILARRKQVEPRCNKDSAYLLKLLSLGDFVEYVGHGPDAGKELHVSFITKDPGVLRLVYFAPVGFLNTTDMLTALSKSVKDTLAGKISKIYWYVCNADPASDHKTIMSGLASQVEDDWPSLQMVVTTPEGFMRWEVTQ